MVLSILNSARAKARHGAASAVNDADIWTGHAADHDTLHTKHNTTFDVVADFGAKGDDTTDDGPAVRDALAAAIAVPNGVVYFPPGTYLMGSLAVSTDAIDLGSSNNLTLEGAGMGLSTIKMGVASWRSVIRGDQSDFIRIANLTIDGNKASFAGSPGIGLRFLSSAANNLTTHRVEILNTDDRAMSITAKVVEVDRCDIHDCDGGIGFNTATDRHVWLTNNYIRDIGTEWTLIQDGVFFGGQYLYAAGNTITRCTDTGINIGGSTDPTGWARVIGNLIFQIGNSGVNTGGGDNQIIKDNIIYACGRKDAGPRSNVGIRIRDDGGGTFTSEGVIVIGNRCYEDITAFPLDSGALGQLFGIEVEDVDGGGTPDDVILMGNVLTDNATGGINLADTPTSLVNVNNLA